MNTSGARTASRWSLFLLILALVGCASQHPRLTVFAEHDEANMRGSINARTATDKVGGSITVDLPTP